MINTYGISSVHFTWDSLEDAFTKCLKWKFDYIEFFTTRFNERQADLVAQLSDQSGIGIGYHAPYLGEFDLGRNTPETLLPRIKEIFRIATAIKAKYIVTHLGFYENRKSDLARIVRVINEYIVPQLEHYQIRLGIENFTLCHGENALGDCLDDFEFIFRHITSPLVGFTIDYGHAHITRNIVPYLNHFGKRLVSAHVADNEGMDDQHIAVGKGTIPWNEVLTLTSSLGFTGPYIMECQDPIESSKTVRWILEEVSKNR